MKHAWLVIAHNEFEILQMQIDALDHPESDIYVHIDKKVKNIPRLRAGKSNLYVLERRLDVRWGSVSQIECELLLMSEAVAVHCCNASWRTTLTPKGVLLPI